MGLKANSLDKELLMNSSDGAFFLFLVEVATVIGIFHQPASCANYADPNLMSLLTACCGLIFPQQKLPLSLIIVLWY